MIAKDIIHDAVKHALIKDGWKITDDPYKIEYEEYILFADLGAEHPIAAERGTRRIVVEIKSFVSRSPLHDLEKALGQYMIYQGLLELTAPERELYLAVSTYIYDQLFTQKATQAIVQRYQLATAVVDVEMEEIRQWIK